MPVLKIQPGPGDTYDTYVDEANPDTNYKDEAALDVKGVAPNRQQALVQFDLSGLPAGAIVTKAELGLYCAAAVGDLNIKCHEVSQAWYLDTVTWNNRPIPGLPGIPAVVAPAQWTVIDVLSIVQDWLENPEYNLGFQILSALCDNAIIVFNSGDYLFDPTQRPYLELTYTGGQVTVNPLLESVQNDEDFETSSTNFVDVPNLSITIPNIPAGAKAKISFAGMTYNHVKGSIVLLDIDVDGIQLGNVNNGIMYPSTPDNYYRMDSSFSVCTDPLSAGSHTFKLIAKVDAWMGVIVGTDSPSFLSVLIVPDITAPFPPTPANTFPVGAVYLSVVDTNPTVWFGGTWVRIAQGRCLVGLAEGDADFDTAEKFGGAKTHALLIAEMPLHGHPVAASAPGTPQYPVVTAWGPLTYNSGGVGGSGPHNNLQPYFVVYMWKRTA